MNEKKRNLTARYFSLDEILAKNDRSELIDLIQDPSKVANMQSLLSILDNLREEFGKPIIINSFYRDSAHNLRVGGVKTSKHLRGAAVDITSPDFDNLYQVVIHSVKYNLRVLPYIKRKFLHLELIKYHQAAEAILYLMMNDPKFIRKYKIELNYFPEEKYKLIANDILAYKEINGEFDIADFMTYINDLEYKEDIYRILNDYQDKILPEEFDNFVAIINKWIRESKIDKLKEQLKNETDVKKQEELNDLIIKIKKGSED